MQKFLDNPPPPGYFKNVLGPPEEGPAILLSGKSVPWGEGGGGQRALSQHLRTVHPTHKRALAHLRPGRHSHRHSRAHARTRTPTCTFGSCESSMSCVRSTSIQSGMLLVVNAISMCKCG